MWNKRNRNKRPTALDSEVTEENPKEQKKEIIDQMWIHVQVFTSADRTDIHTPWCLRFTIQANNLNHRTTAPYSSGRPGIGNWPAKVSTSVLISAALCWNFSSWDRAWTNSFRGALGSRLLCTSKVNSMPAKEGEQPTQQDCVALFVLVKKKSFSFTPVNEVSYFPEVMLYQTSGGQSWGAKPQTTGTQSTFVP